MDNYIGMMLDNRYELLEKIGEGGMAVVYKARCHRLNRFVAVKILRPEYAGDEELRRRFYVESQAVAMLSHPNIVAVYDVNRSGSLEYMVMELIDGITLKQYMMRRGQLNWRESLHFATQITRALSHAHSRGIIHRDIKPQNIMILREGTVKVADFGIARISAEQSTLTQEALGSVHYISPEQAKGSHIDGRSDIYSVGVVLYEMLTGRLPFEGDTAVSVAIQHINSIPLSPREIDPSLPEGLEEITMKAMSSDLSKRYMSADDMYRDLEEFRKNPAIVFGYQSAVLGGDRYFTGTSQILDIGRAAEITEKPDAVLRDSLAGGSRMDKNRSFSGGGSGRNTTGGSGAAGDDYDDDRIYSARSKRRSNNRLIGMITAVLAVFVLVGVMLYFLWGVLKPMFNPEDETVTVPDFLGQMYDDVVESYGEQFVFVQSSASEYNDSPEGTILDQKPSAGRKVEAGETITLTVSKGARELTLGDYSGKEYRSVQTELDQLGYIVELTYKDSDDIIKNYVIGTEPEAGTLMGKGETVKLIISLGPNVVKVVMPSLIGQTQENAETLITNAKLNVGQITMVESQTSAAGLVVYQSIQPDMEVSEGSSVDLHISIGSTLISPSPSIQPSPSVSPTPTPTTVTQKIKIQLPSDRETVHVVVKVDGNVVYDETVETQPGILWVPITGNSRVWVDIYFDNELAGAQEVVLTDG